jgi:hypothetical protein
VREVHLTGMKVHFTCFCFDVFIFPHLYCNRCYQHIVRQCLCKHRPRHNNRGSCVFCRSDAPVDWLDSSHVIYVYCRSVSIPLQYK